MSIRNPQNKVEERPAESTAAAVGTVLAVIALLTGVEFSPEESAVIVAALGVIPAVVTRIVNSIRDRF